MPITTEVVALIGNPNTGKTSLFNCLTGAKQKIGNWPGVTVEKKEGTLSNNKNTNIVDLPGTYSLDTCSADELVARNFILIDKPDTVINVVDATNLKRNLYLTIQLLEMGANLILALNMMDEAKNNKINIDILKLSFLLKMPVVPTTARNNHGITELINVLKLNKPQNLNFHINYGEAIENVLQEIENILISSNLPFLPFSTRFLALKMLENDNSILKMIENTSELKNALAICEKSRKELLTLLGEKLDTIFIEKRYEYIDTLLQQTVKVEKSLASITTSDKIDKIILNKYAGLPIYLLTMLAIFKFTFTVSTPLSHCLEILLTWLGNWIQNLIPDGLLSSFLVEGLIGGMGAIIVFLPTILCLYLAISLLENSGYMSRGAYIMDRFMRSIGLEGKSFIPLVIGFGCNVPAILATKTLENPKDKMITILITPLMSCSARLPVYALFISAFFSQHQGLILFSLYFLGIVLAIIMAKIFRVFFFPGDITPLVMELPPYRLPAIKSTFIQMWQEGSSFLKKVGTIVFAVVILAWALSNFPWGVEYAGPNSLIGKIGSFIAPLLAPLGFGTREAASALLFGTVAKEVVVSTLGVLYSASQGGLVNVISQTWTPLSSLSFMVMTLIYVPCAATIGAIKTETGSWKWAAFSVLYTFSLAWIIAFLVYQGGLLLGWGL
ncbi:MAG: ferrous iron transport protein B [Clostridia bacterium]|nr:ferrous iron transport protein B [Clostridia bacterium]